MIEVRRQGRSGNLLETDGPVLCIDFGENVAQAIFRATRTTYRFMELRRGPIHGWAQEDKVHIVPSSSEKVELGLQRDIAISTDPGGDIFLELSQEAGRRYEFRGERPLFPIEDISDYPAALLERGIDTLYLPSLFVIEQERRARTMWGISRVDPLWEKET